MKKQIVKSGMLMFISLLTIVSCSKSGDDLKDNIEGSYYGTFTRSSTLKSNQTEVDSSVNGTADVTIMEDNQIEVHCYGGEIDTTFMLDYYQHHDSAFVCFTGEDFEHMYGHRLGSGHMGGGMMGDIDRGETEWMHHLGDEHEADDMHFGGFDMHQGSFSYSIRMMDENEPYYMNFSGSKELK